MGQEQNTVFSRHLPVFSCFMYEDGFTVRQLAFQDFGDDDDNPFDEPLDKVHGTLVTSVLAASPANSFG